MVTSCELESALPLNHAHCHGLSNIGRIRPNNEDQFLIADLNKSMIVHRSTLALLNETRLFSSVEGQLLLVADGMGGHAAGERASQLTAETIANHILHTMPWFLRLQHAEIDSHLDQELMSAVMQCERVVDAEAAAIESERDMGTTLTLAYVIWPRMFVVHVGDTRCYLLRNGLLNQVTRDHTLLKMYEDGGVTVNEKNRRHYGHVLVNSIGRGPDKLFPEVYKVDLETDDTVLLCSDGLTDMVSDSQIQAILQQNGNDEVHACEALVAAANDAGGRDNVTVVVARYPKSDDTAVSARSSLSDTAEMEIIH